MSERVCSVKDCGREVVARGWCKKHWTRWSRYGDPLTTRRKRGDECAHGTRSKYQTGCRCDECREANRLYIEAGRRAAGVQPQPRGPQTDHGTVARYENWQCRCSDCRAAVAAKAARLGAIRRARLEAGEVEVEHGKYTTYTNYGCRCEQCKRAASVYNAEKYARRKKAA